MWIKIKVFFSTLWLGIKKTFIASWKWLLPISIVAIILFFLISKLTSPMKDEKELIELINNFKKDWINRKQELNNQMSDIDKQINQIKQNKVDRQNNTEQYIKPKI